MAETTSKTTSKHTPGPWIAKRDGQGGYLVLENRVEMWLDAADIGCNPQDLVALEGTQWCEWPAMNQICGSPMGKADAFLVAAAPDLLEVVRRCEHAMLSVLASYPVFGKDGKLDDLGLPLRNNVEAGKYLNPIREAARAAIAKAEGGVA